MRSGPGAARTILLFHIISDRPSKQPLMVRTFLKVYMELVSYFFVSARTNKRHHHHLAKAVTDLLRATTGDNDVTCTSEMWQMAIRVRDNLLVPMAQKLVEERGQRIWTTCMEKRPEVLLCFQGIHASSRHQALALLKEAEINAEEEEGQRATCIIRRRRGARPPLRVRTNNHLHNLLLGYRQIGQHKIEIWVCREEEHLRCVTRLVQDQ